MSYLGAKAPQFELSGRACYVPQIQTILLTLGQKGGSVQTLNSVRFSGNSSGGLKASHGIDSREVNAQKLDATEKFETVSMFLARSAWKHTRRMESRVDPFPMRTRLNLPRTTRTAGRSSSQRIQEGLLPDSNIED